MQQKYWGSSICKCFGTMIEHSMNELNILYNVYWSMLFLIADMHMSFIYEKNIWLQIFCIGLMLGDDQRYLLPSSAIKKR